MKKAKRLSGVHYPYIKFHGLFYPLIPVVLKKGKKTVSTLALLDSGASVSVFRPEIAKALGLSINGKNVRTLKSAGGGVAIHEISVGLDMGGASFSTRVGFSNQAVASFNIIGREGVFSRFSIVINEMMKTVILVPLKEFRT